MKKLGTFREYLREAEEKDGKNSTEYKEFFQKMLDKYKVTDPSELSKEDKQKFFDEVDAGWKAPSEKKEVNESTDKILEDLLKDVSALYEKFNKSEQKIKVFSQSKLTEVKVKIMDALEK